MKQRKVTVQVTVDLDKWRAEYGIGEQSDALTLAQVTDDIAIWVMERIDQCGLNEAMVVTA